MKIFLTSIGTRGDIEPFIALGQILEEKGHIVNYAFPEQFGNLVPDRNMHYPLSPKIIELINGEKGQIVMGKANVFDKAKALWYLYREGQKANKIITHQHLEAINKENPDIVISNSKCSFPTLWSLAENKPNIILSPVPYLMHYVKGHAHIGFGKDYGAFINKLTYRLANFGLSKTIYKATGWLPDSFKFSRKRIHNRLLNSKMLYTISPSLFKRPTYWPKHVQVLGYHKIQKTAKTEVNPRLNQFLNKNEKILFITFGSMLNDNPEKVSNLILSVLSQLDIPVIVNTASGGLVELDSFSNNPNFLFTKFVSYDDVFPKVYAVIHHGGSGTTHTALKYACPSMIIPHVIDQYQWNKLIEDMGAGPLGQSINKLDAATFKASILNLLDNPSYKVKVDGIANQMKNESATKSLHNFILNEYNHASN